MDAQPYAWAATDDKIQEVVRRIVEGFDPEKIILFGSHARGTAGRDSDVDLLIVMDVEGSRRTKATEMELALVGIKLATDLILVTPEQVERDHDQIGTIIRPALREGKVLYEREPLKRSSRTATGSELRLDARYAKGRCSTSEKTNRDRAIGEWVEKAEHDLRTAEHVLTLEENCPFDMVCFHAQQCAGKYLKALLILRSVDFPGTHNLEVVMGLMPPDVSLELDATEVTLLTRYAAELRYPGDAAPITRAEAEEAVATARKVREAVRQHLPGEALGEK